MTLNEIAYNIADAAGRGTNAAYIERLKFQIKYYRSLLIRRDQERNRNRKLRIRKLAKYKC